MSIFAVLLAITLGYAAVLASVWKIDGKPRTSKDITSCIWLHFPLVILVLITLFSKLGI